MEAILFKFVANPLVFTVLFAMQVGCSQQQMKETAYETLQNLREQECSRTPSQQCEKREDYRSYEQQRSISTGESDGI